LPPFRINRVPKPVQTTLVAIAALATGYGAALWRSQPVVAPVQAADTAPARDVMHSLLDEVAERVQTEYVDQVVPSKLERAAILGMVSSLDPHSALLDADAYDEMRINTAGSYTGLGIEIAADNDRVVVVTPIEGSPAAAAGVRSGDVILSIDGQPVTADAIDRTIVRMRGRPGSRVRLAVSRDGVPQPLEFDLERSEVHVRTVSAEPLPDGFGYVRITQFSDSTPADLDHALASLRPKGGPALRGLVLDLRGNPGGVLEAATAVADEFIDSGMIVKADGRAADARFEIDATPGDALDGAPLAVLVDAGSASGSEIVAGALRDHGRATLLGERTYGKGSVQTVIPLRDGQALKLTTSRYYTPSGASINKRGLDPDVVLTGAAIGRTPPPVTEDAVVRTALQYLKDRGLGPQLAQVAHNSGR
jgi:carboxyl-terminal processing protease